MIVTVTPNPAIDRTVVVDGFQLGQINRVKRSRVDVGGKGINVAKNIKALGGKAVCLGFLGKRDDFVLEYVNRLGLGCDFTLIENSIRVDIKIIDVSSAVYTDINEPGPEIAAWEEEKLLAAIKAWAGKAKVLVMAGSLPPGVRSDFYQRAIRMVKDCGTVVILDAEKEALRLGIDAVPYMIKPNLAEFCGIVNKQLETTEEIIREAQQLIHRGLSVIAVSMGARGSITVTKEKAYLAAPLSVEVKSTAGAGDAMVAGFALALDQGLELEQAVKIATAASSAAVTREGTVPVDLATFQDLLAKVAVTKIVLEGR